MTAAQRVRAFAQAWAADGRGEHMYRGYGSSADTDDPAQRLAVADLLTLAAAAEPDETGPNHA